MPRANSGVFAHRSGEMTIDEVQAMLAEQGFNDYGEDYVRQIVETFDVDKSGSKLHLPF